MPSCQKRIYLVSVARKHRYSFVADAAEYTTELQPSTAMHDISFPVFDNNNYRSRLRAAYSAPRDWQLPCSETAEVVHRLAKTRRPVYARYRADGRLPASGDLDADSTITCLERRFRWTGFASGPTPTPTHAHKKLPEVARRLCPPEVRWLALATNVERAAYLAVEGGADAVARALRCIPLERLSVQVVSLHCRGVAATSDNPAGARFGLSPTGVCINEMTRRGWSLHTETERDLVFVRTGKNYETLFA